MPEFRTNNMPFNTGQTIIVTGIPDPNAADGISLNFGLGDRDIALYMNLRFSTSSVVYNSYQDGQWGAEVFGKGFPFQQGVEFSITIAFTPTQFVITLSDGTVTNFPNRLGNNQYTYFISDGKVCIESLMMK